MSKPTSDFITQESLAKLLGIQSYDKVEDFNQGYLDEVFGEALKNAERDGLEGDEADEQAMKAVDEERTELYHKYQNALEQAADELFREHGLMLSEMRKGGYKISPTKSWRDAAALIMETINGVGYFEFTSVDQFIRESSERGARGTVLTHLHWIKERPRIYGSASAERVFERAFR